MKDTDLDELSAEKRKAWASLQERVVELALLVGGAAKYHGQTVHLGFREWVENKPRDTEVSPDWDCEITAKAGTGEVLVLETFDEWESDKIVCKLTDPPAPPKLLPRRLLEAAPAVLTALAGMIKSSIVTQIAETKKAVEAADNAIAEVKKQFNV